MTYKFGSTILTVEGVSVTIGGKQILKDINFTEKDVICAGTTQGQTIAVLGRSGAGKSTLFRCLTGLLKPTTGKVLIPNYATPDPLDTKEVEPGDVGFVHQKFPLLRSETVYSALMYAARDQKISHDERRAKVLRYLDEWGLGGLGTKYPGELSGGQQQRVAILEQVLCSGYYLVLDEPFSGLDVGNIEDVKETLRLITTTDELNTVIFSTHDLELAVSLADSIYVIGHPIVDGMKAAYGTIISHYDLKELGLAWKTYDMGHHNLTQKIKEDMLRSK